MSALGLFAAVASSYKVFIGLATVLFLAVSFLRIYLSYKYARLPPGPPPDWKGKYVEPRGRSWLALEQMQHEYGPIIAIRNGPFQPPNIYITRAEPVLELLEKRGATTGDRPSNYVASQGMGLLFARYGDKFRRLRKAVHQLLMPKMAESYGPLSERAARNMLRDILDDSTNFKDIFHTYASSVINSMTFAKRNKTHYSDPSLVQALAWNRELVVAVTPGGYKRQLQDYLDKIRGVQQEMLEGQAPPSFVKYMTEKQDEYGLTQEELAWLSGSLYHAGSDTAAVTINHGLLAAAKRPAAQIKVKAELDMVVGNDRTPSFDDLPNLPYLNAFIREVYRWRSPNPRGFPHRMMQDEELNDYIIPKDSLVYGVHWCLHRDPSLFDDVDTFKPERWLETDEKGELRLRQDMQHFTWGFGRRNCPGLHIAERSIFINLAAFDLSEDPSAPINTDPATGYIPAGICSPYPYKVVFRPRQPDLENILGGEELLIDE
ncbi:cytochrome P450 [Dacryopinax primogenitus]|uniref:Cytochrome P450 n=1 Tax=Dacryopinax primogenitus (strain DJM 731) TaxID=1858805 RepID=M5G4Z7_DACPD|nr:cytochrome P450 [Dacryopinax primogenitus]EJT98827.1 cytochrome P450 [Dacryopinax primogenitus]